MIRGLVNSLLGSVAFCGLSAAASAQVAAPAPVRQNVDKNGVDLYLGTVNVMGPKLSMGQDGVGSMTYFQVNRGNDWADNLSSFIDIEGSDVIVSFKGSSDRFNVSTGTYKSTEVRGTTLSLSGNIYTYTTSDGTVAHFDKTLKNILRQQTDAFVTDIRYPSGALDSYDYDTVNYCTQGSCYLWVRLNSITNSANYKIKYYYYSKDFYNSSGQSNGYGWVFQTSVDMTNLTTGYTVAQTHNIGDQNYKITDAMGRVTAINRSGPNVLSVTGPGSSAADVTYTYANGGVGPIATVTNAAGTTNYAYSDAGNVRTVTVTDPLGHATIYKFDMVLQKIWTITDPKGNVTTYLHNFDGNPSQITSSDGKQLWYGYDYRGNVKEVRQVSNPPANAGGIADVVITSMYPDTCSAATAATCNKPIWTKDANGNQIDYSYDPTTGNTLSVTAPPVSGGVRPTISYSYSAVNGVQLLSGISTCRTTVSCVGTADEKRTAVAYNANLLPNAVTRSSGDGSINATTTFGYDEVGNKISIDGPLSGAADTTTYRYDADREMVGIIAPDPDGAGGMNRRASRMTYDPKGRVTLTENGTVTDTSDAAWSAFAPAQSVSTSYDSLNRKLSDTLSAGGAAYALTQYSYDHQRLDCVAVRMNSALWAGLPASACDAQGVSGAGPDRITKYTYDEADRPTTVTSGYGTADAADTTTTYAGGKVSAVTDANGNTTTYEYDALARLVKTRFPSPSAAGSSSTTDYEQLTLDPNSNVTSRRLRDGKVINYAYNGLNQLTGMSFANPTDITDSNVSYTYDLTGNLTQAIDANGHQITRNYDAWGRLTSERSPIAVARGVGATNYEYDSAGRMTRMTWPDGFAVAYDYRPTGENSAIRDGAGNPLVSFGYDDLGRRTSLTRANGTVTTYAYDPASRLSQLTQDIGATASDLTVGFQYNPVSQITSRTSSNDAYAWTGYYNVARPYTVNGLNQLTSAGATALGYDGRGNLTTSGTTSYNYNSKNQLSSASGPTNTVIYHDPLGMIDQIWATGTEFDNSMGRLATEWINGSIARRYVYGPGSDEPLIWYEGAGTSDRRWLHADERGSVIAVSNDAGNTLAINTYDEYGIPAAGNLGRFQYTGQKWIPELGLYDYKARIYSPTLGRFMQSDPIGYGDGLNMYNYVGGDPVNATDPTGMLLSNWEWSCYGNCGGAGSGYWNWYQNGYFRPSTDHSPIRGLDWDEVGIKAQWVWVNTPSWGALSSIFGGGNSFSVGIPREAISNESQGGAQPQSAQTPTCPGGAQVNFGGGVSATGFLGLLGVSVGGGITASVPTASLPIVGDGSFRGTQITGSLSITPLAGLGVFLGAGPNYSLGGSSTSTGRGGSGSVTPTIQAGAGDGAGVEVSSDFTSPLGVGGSGGRIAGGAYAAAGARFSGNLSTGAIGCK